MTADGLSIEYETFGVPGEPPVLLIMGFGAQLVAWPRRFCERLAAGDRTAAVIPGARLLLLKDMGHDRPEPRWPKICDAILEHTQSSCIA